MEILIALDTYDDIFSDFDIRGYGERAISRDFLDELHIRLRRLGTRTGFDLVLIIPKEERDAGNEALIIERLRTFFDERHAHYFGEDRKRKLNSLLFVAIGLALSFAANFFVERFLFFPLIKDFLLIPAWFFVWSGLDLFFKNREEIGRKKNYYIALAGSRTVFRDREEFGGGVGVIRSMQ
jgi:hypothetical protein